MLRHRTIRFKLIVGLGLIVLVVVSLAISGMISTYAYRDLVNSISWRVVELPLAAELSQHVSKLRIIVSELRGVRAAKFPDTLYNEASLRQSCRNSFRLELIDVSDTLESYRKQLDGESRPDERMADIRKERATVEAIESKLAEIRKAEREDDWMLEDAGGRMELKLDRLQELTDALPSNLHEKLKNYNFEVQGKSRGLINCVWLFTILAAVLFAIFIHVFYTWIFRPLKTLVAGSRRVAEGDFDYRIRLSTNDEIAELAEAMNDMTARFQDIRDDLDSQVQERTKQVVRAEQMASVGFLAAGVAHEINNPLASIAMCAESLEGRIGEALDPNDERHKVIAHYLQMIQSEAFRCKGITEKLLDFSRIGPVKRQHTDLGELVMGVIEMVRHIGKYQRKQIDFGCGLPVVSHVSSAEIKQVVLNLLTNALDSLDENGIVQVEIASVSDFAEIVVRDNGCGMTPDVLKHIFEPFFTRRRGGQGTGLGLSICYRIVSDHGGTIEGQSEGPGQGATFIVRLPLVESGRMAA
jgi:signal transduction histidine kinase